MMKNIRRSVFETNSSSTHCLVIRKSDLVKPVPEDIFLRSYKIDPRKNICTKSNEAMYLDTKVDGYVFTDIEDKLVYLSAILLMAGQSRFETGSPAYQLYELMKLCFPNAEFLYLEDFNDYDYLYEDGDCWFFTGWDGNHPHECDIEKMLNEQNFRHLMQYGKIYFGNRDDYDEAGYDFYSFVHDYLMDKENNLFCETSG